MKISNAFPSNYLKAVDLGGRPHIVTVRSCVMEQLGQGKDKQDKPVLYFTDRNKGLVLNVTNAKAIAKAYGDDTGFWEGKAVEVYPTEVEFKGDRVDGIRVRAPEDSDTTTKANSNIDDELDNEIPF